MGARSAGGLVFPGIAWVVGDSTVHAAWCTRKAGTNNRTKGHRMEYYFDFAAQVVDAEVEDEEEDDGSQAAAAD